jgi:hypothetical protein
VRGGQPGAETLWMRPTHAIDKRAADQWVRATRCFCLSGGLG